MQLVGSHYNMLNGTYDLNLIEEEIVMSYIAGRWRIYDCKENLYKQFNFKPQITTQSRTIGDPTEYDIEYIHVLL